MYIIKRNTFLLLLQHNVVRQIKNIKPKLYRTIVWDKSYVRFVNNNHSWGHRLIRVDCCRRLIRLSVARRRRRQHQNFLFPTKEIHFYLVYDTSP
jgi:hypothetical protein